MASFLDWLPFLKRKSIQINNNANVVNKKMRIDFDPAQLTETQEADFMSSIKKILSCAVCFEVVSQTKQCRNGHLICFQCINRMQQSTSDFNCPVCRCSLKKGLMRSLIAEQMVLELPALCKYCQASMSVKDLKVHESLLCLQRDVSCEYKIFGCAWTGKAEAALSHCQECEFRKKPVSEIQETVSHFAKEIKDTNQRTLNQWSSLIDKIRESSEGYKFVVKQIMLDRRRQPSKKKTTNSKQITFKSSVIHNANSCCRRHGWIIKCFLKYDPLKVEYKLINDSKKKHKVSFFISSIQCEENNILVVDQLHVVQFSRGLRESGQFEIDIVDPEPHMSILKVADTISVDLCIFYEVDPDDIVEQMEETEEEEEETETGSNFLLALLSPNLQAAATEEEEAVEEEEADEEEEEAESVASGTSSLNVETQAEEIEETVEAGEDAENE